jgi:hypothetical protein
LSCSLLVFLGLYFIDSLIGTYVLLWFNGFFIAGRIGPSYLLMMEMVPQSSAKTFGAVAQTLDATAFGTLAVVCYFFGDAFITFGVMSTLTLIFAVLTFFAPESLHFLHSKGRYDEI